MCSVLHHFEMCVSDHVPVLTALMYGYGFRPYAFRNTEAARQWVLSCGTSLFIVTKRHSDVSDEHWTTFCCHGRHTLDSVFNVALRVKDVDAVTSRVLARGGHVLRPPCDVTDGGGRVRYAVVRSFCGNIVHTLIDRKGYNGVFLPGYLTQDLHSHFPTLPEDADWPMPEDADWPMLPEDADWPTYTHVDHVTFVCEVGTSRDLITWYEDVFRMKRFITNGEDNVNEGFVLAGDIGMRLKAMEYWRCAEIGLIDPSSLVDDHSLKFVIAEALPEVEKSHVDTFLKEHKGPGVQHIGICTSQMVSTVNALTRRGVKFRVPPPTYYEEGGKLGEILAAGFQSELDQFRQLGILLDAEADILSTAKEQPRDRYLLQIFSHPFFSSDTFFFEIIQRSGARGFGSGNITALAKSIILHQERLVHEKLLRQIFSQKVVVDNQISTDEGIVEATASTKIVRSI